VAQVLRHYDLDTWVHNYEQEKDRDCAGDVYAAVESDGPALVVFETAARGIEHVVLAVGHTLNTDLWLPLARPHYFLRQKDKLRHFDSTMWVEDFVVHDDNFGMLLCLPAAAIWSGRDPSILDNDEFEPVQGLGKFCISDKQGNVDGRKAEILALDVLYKFFDELQGEDLSDNIWLHRLGQVVRDTKKGPLARTFMITRDEYLTHLSRMPDGGGVGIESEAIKLAKVSLPAKFWITDLALPHLFTANRRKLGEVLCSSQDAAAVGLHGQPKILLVRLPGLFAVSGRDPLESRVTGHVPICCAAEDRPYW